MKKLIVRAPVMTASGYGVHSRMLLREIIDSGKFDITIISTGWGVTPVLYESDPFLDTLRDLSRKFNPQTTGPDSFDASLQVTIPNEFQRLAKKNICVTAGIEVDRVSPTWQVRTNDYADFLVVPSVHSARAFTTAIYGAPQKGPDQLLLRKPLYILPEWIDTDIYNTSSPSADIGYLKLDDMPNFNFVAVGLGLDKNEGEDRKNFAQLIRWFCEQFKANPDVGLVLKLSMVNYSPVDFHNVKNRIEYIKQVTRCGQFPKIKLIHGRLSDLELAALYKHPKVKAMVTLTHGEGFGLPIIEAAACGLPIIATDWSGHLDFLQKDGRKLFVPVKYQLAPIPGPVVWKDVMDEGTRWAQPDETDAKMKMAKTVISYAKPKAWATELAEHIGKTFNRSLGRQFAQDLYDYIDGKPVRLTKNVLVKTTPSEKTLDNVTLVSIETRDPNPAIHAINKSLEQIKFGRVLLVVSEQADMDGTPVPKGVDIIKIPVFAGVPDHDQWVMKELPKLIETDFFMTVQPDGYVLNGSAWRDEFLQYDYIGAPWFWNGVVGNAALCIRSMKLARELMSDEYEAFPMDVNVCQTYRKQLEEKGFKWAPPDLASRFSVENLPYEGQFGWHGENPFYGERVEG